MAARSLARGGASICGAGARAADGMLVALGALPAGGTTVYWLSSSSSLRACGFEASRSFSSAGPGVRRLC